MWLINYFLLIFIIFHLSVQVLGDDRYIVNLVNDGPAVEGGIITFTANIFNKDGSKPDNEFTYEWRDSGMNSHSRRIGPTKNTTDIWTVQFNAKLFPAGLYAVGLDITYNEGWWPFARKRSQYTSEIFKISELLNGNITIVQSNKTVQNDYLSSDAEATVDINLRKGDADYVNINATEVTTFWFVDCKYYGQTNRYTFHYNFTSSNDPVMIEALVIASYDPPMTTTVAPTTTTTTTTTTVKPSNATTPGAPTPSTTEKNLPIVTTPKPIPIGSNSSVFNSTFPYICQSTLIPDPNKTYGYFLRELNVRASIKNIKIEGTNWIKPWDLLSLNVSCNGSGPFYKCLEYHSGHYNITGNETCENGERLTSCNFSIKRYFLDPNIYTVLLLLKNDVSTVIYPVTINIYEVTPKPQLSVIVIPVSCSLAAVVLIVFGISYYIQSRSRFNIEVADFDFGQNNPELEYKTFTERLKDSFNNTGYKPLGNPNSTQN